MNKNRRSDINDTELQNADLTHDSGEQLINKTGTPKTQIHSSDLSDLDKHEGSMHNGVLGGNFNEERESGNERMDQNK
jgi:hypothetical protein